MNTGRDRMALFGGSFDPPHCSHLEIAKSSVEQCELSRVIFVPCQESPLKGRQPGAPGPARLEMLRIAVKELSWAEVSDWELSRPGPSYSWQTVEHFAAGHPNADLHWIMGADQWEALDRWARPDFLRENLTFIVFVRDGSAPSPREGWRATFLPWGYPGSSTEARRRLAAGESLEGLVPSDVADYAVRNHLYDPSYHR